MAVPLSFVMCHGSACMCLCNNVHNCARSCVCACVHVCVRACVCACVPVGLILRHRVRVFITGAHVNPAVTVALVVIGKFPLRKVPHYLLGQYAGGFLATALVYCVYYGKPPSQSLRVGS